MLWNKSSRQSRDVLPMRTARGPDETHIAVDEERGIRYVDRRIGSATCAVERGGQGRSRAARRRKLQKIRRAGQEILRPANRRRIAG